MDIVIIADFLGPLDGTFNSRFLYLAKLLEKDNSVEIITSDFHHGKKKYFDYDIEKHYYSIVMLHEGSYASNICLNRFVAHYVWGKNIRKYLASRKTPDVIYCAVPTLKASYEAAKYCKRNQIRFVIDIQDLWPEAFKMAFKVPLLSTLVFVPFRFMANRIYKRADAVCGVSKRYVERALSENIKCKNGNVVYLGTDLQTFEINAKRAKPRIKKVQGEGVWLGYCGSLGASYDISCVISAIKILKDKGRVIPKFIVMGDGEKKEELENEVSRAGIDAVFLGVLPYDQMCAQLVQCDIAVNPIVKGSAASIINKHGDYASAGLPVLNTQESEEYRNLVSDYKMGFNCRNSDAEDLAQKMQKLIENESLRKEMGRNAKQCALEQFDRENTYMKLIQSIVSEEK